MRDARPAAARVATRRGTGRVARPRAAGPGRAAASGEDGGRGEGWERERGYHLRGRQLGHVRDVRERVLGCAVLAVGVGAGLGVVDLRVVLARDVLLVVLHLARLGAALRLAARVFPLGRHRRGTRDRDAWPCLDYSGAWRVRAILPSSPSHSPSLARALGTRWTVLGGVSRWRLPR